ncbi:MAG TPA: G1 family glutamic endopeptidase [Pseudonocardiaceae bacterium]|jgi:hypothetical protein
MTIPMAPAEHGRSTHTLASGMRVTTYHPAKKLDLASASNEDLADVGLPARPDDEHQLARYDRVLHQLRDKFNYIPATLRQNPEIQHRPRQTKAGPTANTATAGTETSTNWSGGVVAAPAGKSFSWVQGDWVIPDVDAPTDNQWYYAASWIGIDGDGSGDVCQAGIQSAVFRSGGSVTRVIYPWWEWFPEPEIQITNLPVNPGDMITALLCTSGAGATSASVFLTNRTTGDSTSVSFSAPTGTSLVGNCAEWIVEAPTVNGQQSAMADYGQVFFSVCEAFLGTIAAGGTTVDGGTGDNINMNDSAGHEVSSGGLVTGTVVQCEYVGALP